MNRVDRIEREITVPHPRQRVWHALTNAESLAEWFGDVAEIDLRPGGAARFGWSAYGNVVHATVEEVDPPSTFAFRWSALHDTPISQGPTTLVTFSLTEVPGGTRLRVVESGLASLPDSLYDRTLQENTSGWKAELDDLRQHLASEGGR